MINIYYREVTRIIIGENEMYCYNTFDLPSFGTKNK